jgi:deoxyhypusine synthase
MHSRAKRHLLASELLSKRKAVTTMSQKMGQEEFVAIVRKLVKSTTFHGITSDLWTEDYTKRDYLGVTLHLWVPGAKKLTRLVIQNDAFDYATKTGANIQEELVEIAARFGLAWPKILAVSGTVFFSSRTT